MPESWQVFNVDCANYRASPVDLMKPLLTMSSCEIAELTGKHHDRVLPDVVRICDGLGVEAPTFGGEVSGAVAGVCGYGSSVGKLAPHAAMAAAFFSGGRCRPCAGRASRLL